MRRARPPAGAHLVALIRSRAAPGVYHATSSGEASWVDLAREVFRLLGADPGRVHATTSSSYIRPAARPRYSVLGHDAWADAGVAPIGDWRLSLGRAFPALRAAGVTARTS
jgi:dTDP-4-dehydrorhamnose reductase